MAVMHPRELYEDPTIKDRIRPRSRHWLPLDRMLVALDAVEEYPNIVNYFDTLYDQDMNAWFEQKDVVTQLPPKAILEAYGEEGLVWAATNCSTFLHMKEFYEALEDLAGYDPDLLEKARMWAHKNNHGHKGKDVFLHYAIMETLMEGALDEIDLPDLLRKSAKPGVNISDKRAGEYSLIPLRSAKSHRPDGPEKDWHGPKKEDNIVYNIWLDAPTGFAITYKGKPNAVVALAPSSDDELMIYQLQGVQAWKIDPEKEYTNDWVQQTISSRGLAPLDWQKLLIKVTAQLAEKFGMHSIGVQSGENNK